jgi:hypothetical protein
MLKRIMLALFASALLFSNLFTSLLYAQTPTDGINLQISPLTVLFLTRRVTNGKQLK